MSNADEPAEETVRYADGSVKYTGFLLAGEMEAAVAAAKAAHRGSVIWIAEMVNKATVYELYSHAAVFCCPSIYEPFGIINLEAMACETAVVASAVGGIKEVVVHGETGVVAVGVHDLLHEAGGDGV